MPALSGKAGSEEVEGVCACCCHAAGEGTCYERLDGLGKTALVGGDSGVDLLEGLCGCAICGELNCPVTDIQQFGGDVAFPETLEEYE